MKFKIYLFLKLITTLIPTAKFLLLLDPFQKALVCECVYRNVFKMHILNILNYRGIQEKNIGFGSLRGLLGVFCRSSCLVGGFCFGGLVWFGFGLGFRFLVHLSGPTVLVNPITDANSESIILFPRPVALKLSSLSELTGLLHLVPWTFSQACSAIRLLGFRVEVLSDQIEIMC